MARMTRKRLGMPATANMMVSLSRVVGVQKASMTRMASRAGKARMTRDPAFRTVSIQPRRCSRPADRGRRR